MFPRAISLLFSPDSRPVICTSGPRQRSAAENEGMEMAHRTQVHEQRLQASGASAAGEFARYFTLGPSL
jgi:hypothetical protein